MVGKRKWRLKITCTRKKKKQHMTVRQTDDRDWAGLADYLLELVIKRLPLVDCLSFSSVCKPWRSTTTKLFEGSSRVIPLLVKPGQSENITKTCLNVLDKNKNLSLDIPMPEDIGSHICGSYRDWLFLGKLFGACVLQITLLNPFSGEKVVLPEIFNKYHTVVLSSVPSDPRCICMLVEESCGVAFWTSGAQDWCKCFGVTTRMVVDALYHEGQFYLLNDKFEMVIIDEKRVIDNMLNIDWIDGPGIGVQYLQLKEPCFEVSSRYIRKYIVESSGDIILVCRIFNKNSEETRGFGTFRLDVSQSKWVKLESLGDKFIMLGKSCSRSFHAKEELGDAALANNIYFSNGSSGFAINPWSYTMKFFKERNHADDWGVFSLHKESNDWPHAFGAPVKLCPGNWVAAPIWWCLRQQTLKH